MTQVQVFAVQIARIAQTSFYKCGTGTPDQQQGKSAKNAHRNMLSGAGPARMGAERAGETTTKALAPHRAIKDIHESWRESKQPYFSFGGRRETA